ncbi:MAG: FAD-binding protein [Bacteroidales bacterium]|nr:FAD-binding protein [Bacteroidales bacterium]MCF8314275.1 FAD-binding protein [Saprospiraceae bacterium]MCF8443106.1 FAD-binding protein [Saprospiraceae bacterium]
MRQIIEIKLTPADAANEQAIRKRAADICQLKPTSIDEVIVLRKSIDARGSQPLVQLKLEVFVGEKHEPEAALLDNLRNVADATEIIIVGAGPTGYFAALELIELGLKPVIFDRGKDVQTRRRDLRAIQQFGIVNPNSNYCFGEGGAGTYSDGKLYTRSHKRGDIFKALKLFVEHGANPDILVEAHPHIGSNKLPQIVSNIRETILHFGGEVHFDSLVTDFIVEENQLKGVVVNEGAERRAASVILATGHSARDVYAILHKRNILIEAKPFALGVRVEHPQALIDKIQYRQENRDEHLPASSYRLACQVGQRGVFSFCMCPGGLVVPAATSPGEIVVNGMSMSRRDSKYANSGTVVQVENEDLHAFAKHGVFSSLEFQKSVEQTMFKAGTGGQQAPAQRMTDFVSGKTSVNLPGSSYIPGLFEAPLHELLPLFIYEKLKKGMTEFGRKMRGYFTEEANIIATESRTSSPVKIPRNKETYMHVEVAGLFPAGEGAGYAGGIISAAMDGQNVARAVKSFVQK